MIARAVLMILLFGSAFFALFWAMFRTKFFTAFRVAEIAKTSSILTLSTFLAAVVVGVLIAAEKLF